MEKNLNKIYSQAADGISEKWYKYMQSHEAKLKNSYDALQEAKKSGDQDAIQKAQADYDRVVRNVTLNNDKYKAMLNETTAKLAHTNEIALDYVNGKTAKIYTLNYNEFASQDIDGYTFTLVNEQTVKNLATEDKSLLPKRKLDVPKDKEWNIKNINSEILQGILQGENINKIADRLGHVTDMNKNSAIRNARTMTTSAENKGRQDSFKKAQDDGVIMKRVWVATDDDRTRAWHADLDGVEVGVDEPWENEYGSIMYPGDPSADPCNVYNCRCSIKSIVEGFNRNEEEEPEEVTPIILDTSLPTLTNYESTYEGFKEKRASQIEDMALFEKMNSNLNDLVENNEFRMRFPIDDAETLRSILTDGEFKTQFETGTSGGQYSPEIRRYASENLFGTGKISDSEYEKYGYLGSKDLTNDWNPQLSFYGDGIVTFKKDSMMDHTTLTVGDSLRDANEQSRYIMGTPVNDIDSTVAIGRPNMIDEFLKRVDDGLDKYGVEQASQIGYKVRSYIELQYHGPLTLKDVDTLTVDKYILDDVLQDSKLKDKLIENGIKCNYILNNKVIDYDLE